MTSTNPYANETLAERMAREQQEWQEDDDRIRDKGNAAFRAGDLREAYICYTAVINMNEEWLQPAYAVHWLNRAAVCLRLRAYAHAEADAAQALRRARSAKALYRRGRARRFLGRLGEACLDVREALRLKPEDPDLLDELAEIQRLLAMPDDERRAWLEENKGLDRPLPDLSDEDIKRLSSNIFSETAKWNLDAYA